MCLFNSNLSLLYRISALLHRTEELFDHLNIIEIRVKIFTTSSNLFPLLCIVLFVLCFLSFFSATLLASEWWWIEYRYLLVVEHDIRSPYVIAGNVKHFHSYIRQARCLFFASRILRVKKKEFWKFWKIENSWLGKPTTIFLWIPP